MNKNGIFVVILLFLVVADSSSAWNLRKLVGPHSNRSSNPIQGSPLPSPDPKEKKQSKPSPVEVKPEDTQKTSNSSDVDSKGSNNNPAEIKPEDTQKTSNSTNVYSKGSNNNPAEIKPEDTQKTSNSTNVKTSNSSNVESEKKGASSSSDDKIDKGKGHEVKNKSENTTHSQSDSRASCKASPSCSDQNKTLFACIQNSENGSKEFIVLVQNEGEKKLKVNLNILPSVDNTIPPFELPNHQSKKVKIPSTVGKSTKIILNAGSGDCELHMEGPEYERNFFKQLTFYSKQMTPIYGAYLFFLVALVFGGTWACCNLRKRGSEGGVPYQELEMGSPEPTAAVNVETAEGWDQDWDDDWDEDKAVKLPGLNHVGSISANGLTSRTPKRDGWEADWDD